MISELKTLKLSEKVNKYIEYIEEEIKETGFKVLIKDFKGERAGAIVTLDRKNKLILVEINEEKYKNESANEVDSTIAHEVTHELLSIKKGYCRMETSENSSELDEKSELLATMIEDIVVDNHIQERDFNSDYEFYINETVDSINFIRKAQKDNNFFDVDKNDIRFKKLVAEYILTWNYFKYSKSDNIDKKTLLRFLNTVKKYCLKEYEEAEKITSMITKNDIFKPEGYNKTIKECLELWNLTGRVRIYIIKNENGKIEYIYI